MKNIFNLNKVDQKGFTLLEIMVAVAIIAIAFTSILKLYSQTVAMNIASNFYAKAPLLTQKIISEWETGMVTNGSIPTLSDSLEEFAGFTFEISHDTLDSDSLYPENLDDNDSLLVGITCTILYNHGEYHYTTQSIRFLPQ